MIDLFQDKMFYFESRIGEKYIFEEKNYLERRYSNNHLFHLSMIINFFYDYKIFFFNFLF